MDDITAKLLVSRRKSVATLEKEVAALEALIRDAVSPEVRQVYAGQKLVKVQRLDRLRAEVQALEKVDAQAKPPTRR